MSYILGLDVSTKTTGIALFEDLGKEGKLCLLTHVSPKIKPKPDTKIEELFAKSNIFREFLEKYKQVGISRVVIEEPLLRSNNVNTVATLLRFNTLVANDVYQILGIVPEFISSYDCRKYAFPELMAVRTHNRKGEPYTEKEISKKKPTLFGGYPSDVDKKKIIWEKVDALVENLKPEIEWIYNTKGKLKNECFDMSDAYTIVRAIMKRDSHWI